MDYNIEYRKRKTIEIRIDKKANIIVRAPKGYPKSAIKKLVESKEDWIRDTIKKIKENEHKLKNSANSIKDGGSIMILGKKYSVKVQITRDTVLAEGVSIENDDVTISAVSKAKSVLNVHVEKYLRKKARDVIEQRISFYERHIPVKYNTLRIKNQKTRWGSCSSKRNLNFNFRIVMAPVEIVDYIVVHELCHLVHMNHSADFWMLVESIIPDYAERRSWLRKNFTMLEL